MDYENEIKELQEKIKLLQSQIEELKEEIRIEKYCRRGLNSFKPHNAYDLNKNSNPHFCITKYL